MSELFLQVLWGQHISSTGGFQVQGVDLQISLSGRNDKNRRLYSMAEVGDHRNRFQKVHEEGEGRC